MDRLEDLSGQGDWEIQSGAGQPDHDGTGERSDMSGECIHSGRTGICRVANLEKPISEV